MSTQKLAAMQIKELQFSIIGTSPLMQHQWDEKAKAQMRDKGQKKAVTKSRAARNPKREAEAATYYTQEGGYGVPLMAVKGALIKAAHKDIGLDKVTVRKSVFFKCGGSDSMASVTPMTCSEPVIREDMVRVGMGSADIRYRPEFKEWAVPIVCEFDSGSISETDILNLVNRAGFGVGIGEWRPEKGGEHGRFKVDTDVDVTITEMG